MQEYIKKKLQKHEHIWKGPPQHSTHPTPTKKYRKVDQYPIPENATMESSKDKKSVQ